MANLSSLIHELRERIAAASSPSSTAGSGGGGEDPLETRFRIVLPNLLHAYVNPSSTGDQSINPQISSSRKKTFIFTTFFKKVSFL